jgi:flavin-dependent dehydrogenase
LSTWRPLRAGRGRLLLAGDAAGLVNPLTGEGIYYAVASGLLAGRTAARALVAGEGERAGELYTRALRRLLGAHLRHTAFAARLSLHERTLELGLLASADDQHVFDALVELGLAQGKITPTLARGLARSAVRRRPPHHFEETPA